MSLPATSISSPSVSTAVHDEGPGVVSAAPFDGSVLTPRRPSRLADYATLCKLRLNLLVIITTAVGYHLAAGASFHWLSLLHVLIGTTLTAAASAVLNQWMEVDRDRRMPRTRNRPLPAGRVARPEALALGLLLAAAGLTYLALTTNPLTFALGLATLILYLAIYTPLKTISTLNTIIGAIPGAIPPVMGVTAALGHFSPAALTLFGILFLWQMPHFLAIATLYREDYRAGGYVMLPVIDPDLSATSRQALIYLVALLFTSVTPTLFHLTGEIYALSAFLLSAAFLVTGIRFAQNPTRLSARSMFFASITYLPLILLIMVLDKA